MSLLDQVFATMTQEVTLLAIARKRLALISGGTNTKCFFTVKFWDPTLVLSRGYLAKNRRSTSVGRKDIKVRLKVNVL